MSSEEGGGLDLGPPTVDEGKIIVAAFIRSTTGELSIRFDGSFTPGKSDIAIDLLCNGLLTGTFFSGSDDNVSAISSGGALGRASHLEYALGASRREVGAYAGGIEIFASSSSPSRLLTRTGAEGAFENPREEGLPEFCDRLWIEADL